MHISEVTNGFTDIEHYAVRPGPAPRFPLRDLEVGQSFSVQGAEEDAQRLRQAAQNARRRFGMRFTVRKVGPGHWRCWRID